MEMENTYYLYLHRSASGSCKQSCVCINFESKRSRLEKYLHREYDDKVSRFKGPLKVTGAFSLFSFQETKGALLYYHICSSLP